MHSLEKNGGAHGLYGGRDVPLKDVDVWGAWAQNDYDPVITADKFSRTSSTICSRGSLFRASSPEADPTIIVVDMGVYLLSGFKVN